MTIEFSSQWDSEMALAVMRDPNADAQVWADAVRWLLLHGPEEIRELIRQASSQATASRFPDLRPLGYTDAGEPVYDVDALAASLEMTPSEVGEILTALQAEMGIRTLFDPKETHRIH